MNIIIIFCSFFLFSHQFTIDDSSYRIGTSIVDATGLMAGVGFNGYGEFTETGRGIHSRLYVRTFVFVHRESNSTIAISNIDSCFIDQGIKMEVVKRLKGRGLGDIFSYSNVLLTSTHTHSGPGAYSWFKMYNIPEISFSTKEYEIMVNAIVRSISKAHNSLSDTGKIYINSGILHDVTINRSNYSYNKNPWNERKEYGEEGETDKTMVVLRMENGRKEQIGAIIWFPLHGVSMPNKNRLVSSDNHGYAEFLFEKEKSGKKNFILGDESNKFICAFPSANHGDATPNVEGAYCNDNNLCEEIHSTCKKETCNGRGPGYPNSVDSMKIIGNRVYDFALELFEKATEVVSGPFVIGHKFVKMDNVEVEKEFSSTGKKASTCRAAFGDGFAGGTTDGPGFALAFKQGDLSGTKLLEFIIYLFDTSFPTKEQKACQHPKPILFELGPRKDGNGWIPNINPMSLILFGRNLVIAAVPTEMTTMAGRRLKKKIMEYFSESSLVNDDAKITISFSNGYHSYTATYEEYQTQRYEGACTAFGPHQLDMYIQEFSKMAERIVNGKKIPQGKLPNDLFGKQTDIWKIPEFIDTGSILVEKQVNGSYKRGETVEFKIRGGFPLNFLGRGDTFLKIEKKNGKKWDLIMTDSDFDTYFEWNRDIFQENFNNFKWETQKNSEKGTYRFRVFGTKRNILQQLTDYEIVSNEFNLF